MAIFVTVAYCLFGAGVSLYLVRREFKNDSTLDAGDFAAIGFAFIAVALLWPVMGALFLLGRLVTKK